MAVPSRQDIRKGLRVRIVLKRDQGTGQRTEGIVGDILTRSRTHPHGIKVRLEDGQVGRVKEILEAESGDGTPAPASLGRDPKKRT